MFQLLRHHDSIKAGNEIVRRFEHEFVHSVYIYDETLRDGEQTPGVAFSAGQKYEIAAQLLAAGVRHFTVGFPGSSQDERHIVREIARLSHGVAEVWCVSRMRTDDLEAVCEAEVRNVTMFLPASDVHLEAKLGISQDQALRLLEDSISAALRLGLTVRFALEDASRTPLGRLERFARVAVQTGASMLTLADTCGVLTPASTERLFAHMRTVLPDVPFVAHCHNDFGLATANSIAAAVGGATFLQGALGGLGERAGNAPLEELAAILKLKYGVENGIDLRSLCALAESVLKMARLPTPGNKPLLGSRVFAHESGIHVHGLIRDLATYEPFPPEMIGRSHEVRYGKHSGLSNIQYLLEKHSIHLSEDERRRLLELVHRMAIEGKEMTETNVVNEALRQLEDETR